MKSLIEHLQSMALAHGGSLTDIRSLRPMAIELQARNDFSRGVLATIAEVYSLACNVPECRQAVLDLCFEPFLEIEQ